MSRLSTVRAILQHPVNRNRKAAALIRVIWWQLRKIINPTGYYLLESRDGPRMKCYHDSGEAAVMIYYERQQDFSEYTFLRRYLRCGDRFVDCGANVGSYSLFVRQFLGEKGKIWAFEPNKRNACRIVENAALNDYSNIVVLEKAVGSEVGNVLFTDDLDTGNAMAKHRPGGKPVVDVSTVFCTRLDFEIPNEKFSMWKFDVEGAEMEAIEGAAGLLNQGNPPVMQIEVSVRRLVRNGQSLEALKALLEKFDYFLFDYDPIANILVPYKGLPRQPGVVGDAYAVHRPQMQQVMERLVEGCSRER